MEHGYLKFINHSDDKESIFRDIMLTYGQDVWSYAYFLTRRYDAADDITQDVFLKVYEKLFTFRGESSFKTWLLSITRNKSINYLKSAFIRKVTLMEYVIRKGSNRSAENEFIDKQFTEDIWKYVLGLPYKLREVLILEAHYHLSFKEITALLSISEGTVKSRLFRARAKINDLLRGEEE